MLRPDHLGLAFRFLRTSRHLRQHQVAVQAGITPSMLSGYENGRKQPTLATLEKILQAMGCTLRDLVSALELIKEGKQAAGPVAGGQQGDDVSNTRGLAEPNPDGPPEGRLEDLRSGPRARPADGLAQGTAMRRIEASPRYSPSSPQPSEALASAFDLEMIFGAEPLAQEEREAFGEMLTGYCRWLRFLRGQAGSSHASEI